MVPADAESQREARLDQLLAEFLRRRDAGEAVDRFAFLAEHDDVAEELRQLLDTADLVDYMAGPVDGASPDLAPTQADLVRSPAAEDETLTFSPHAADRGNGALHRDTSFSVAADELTPSEESPYIFGDYELLKTLGRGGMGVVFKARQISLNRIVALKMILSGQFASEADIRRFYAEAQAAGKVGHPHIVNVYEMDQVDGRHYFTMEYVEGRTLAAEIDGHPLPPQRVARYLELIARAVQFAHDQGVLHRDLKPANVIIDERDEPQVTDFGLAKDLSQAVHYTASGTAIGTPGYMAPEQAAGRREEVGVAADVYSLGAILYEMLTGRPPFSGDSVVDIMLDVIHKDPLPPRLAYPQADRELEVVCLKCLRKNPTDRYSSAQEVADEMRRYLEGQPIRARPLSAPRRAALWIRDVPVISALLGRRVYAPSAWQVRVQWLALAAAMGVLVALVAWLASEKPLPPQVRIAAGPTGGMYHRVGEALADHLGKHLPRPVSFLETDGSRANRSLLERHEAEMAFLQSDALTSHRLAVVAPLYYEMVLVVVRDENLRSLSDLRGRAIGLGLPGSGVRNAALAILRHYGVGEQDVSRSQTPFANLLTDPTLDGAFIITGFENEVLRRVLTDPQAILLPIDGAVEIADAEPSLRATRLTPQTAPEFLRNKIPPAGLPTLKTPAFLTVRDDASPKLVRAALAAIYRESDLVQREHLIPLEQAAAWPLLPLHPAAEEFFESVRSP